MRLPAYHLLAIIALCTCLPGCPAEGANGTGQVNLVPSANPVIRPPIPRHQPRIPRIQPAIPDAMRGTYSLPPLQELVLPEIVIDDGLAPLRPKHAGSLPPFELNVAQESPPEWSEFSPPEYLTAHVLPTRHIPFALRYALGATWVGLPFAKKSNRMYLKDLHRNYWARRHKDFDKRVGLCTGVSDNPTACYAEVRRMEMGLNHQHLQQMLFDQTTRATGISTIHRNNTHYCTTDYADGATCF